MVQRVTVNGRDEVAVTPAEEISGLKGDLTGQALIDAMQASPHREVDLEPARTPMAIPKNIVIGDATVKPDSGFSPHHHSDLPVCRCQHIDHYTVINFLPSPQVSVLWKVERRPISRFVGQRFVMEHLCGNALDDRRRFSLVFNREIDGQIRSDSLLQIVVGHFDIFSQNDAEIFGFHSDKEIGSFNTWNMLGGGLSGFSRLFGRPETFSDEPHLSIKNTGLDQPNKNEPQGEHRHGVLPPSYFLFVAGAALTRFCVGLGSCWRAGVWR